MSQETSLQPSHSRLSATELFSAGMLFFLASVILFHPYAPVESLGVTMGYGDATHFTYYLAWAQKCLLEGNWREMFHPPLRYPLAGAGMRTDILPGLAVQLLPLRLFTQNPVAIYNVATLLCGTLNALAAYALAREAGANRWGALCGAIAFAFSGFMSWHAAGHLSVLAVFWTPLMLLFAIRLLSGGRIRWAVAVAFALFMQGATSSRLGLIALLCLVVFVLAHGLQPWRTVHRSRLAFIVALVVLALAGVACVYSPLWNNDVPAPNSRSVLDVALCSLDAFGLFLPYQEVGRGCGVWGWLASGRLLPPSDERNAFLGFTIWLVLLWWGWIRYRNRSAAKEADGWSEKPLSVPILPFVVLIVVGFIVAVGPYLWINGHALRIPMPWLAVIKTIPALATFRVIGRVAIAVSIGLSVLFALALTRITPAHRKQRYCLYGLVALGMLIDFFPLPGQSTRYRVQKDTVLSQHLAANSPDKIVLQLPYPGDPVWSLNLIPSFNPTVNRFIGGLEGPRQKRLDEILAHPTTQLAKDFLRDANVSIIVSHDETLSQAMREDSGYVAKGANVFALAHAGPLNLPRALDYLEPKDPEEWPEQFRRNEDPVLTFSMAAIADTCYAHESVMTTEDGILHLRSTGTGPFISLFPRSLDVSGVNTIAVRLRYKDTLCPKTPLAVYWRSASGPMSELTMQAVDVPTLLRWQVVELPVGQNPAWHESGLIQEIRIDPANPGYPGDLYEIQEVRLYK